MPPILGSTLNKPAPNPYKSTKGKISYKITEDELPKLVKIFESQNKEIRYNKDGTVNKSQFNNLVRDLRLREYRLRNLNQEKATEEMKKKYMNKKITRAQVKEVGLKMESGEISMEDGKKVSLYYYKDHPLELCQALFSHMLLDKATNEPIPSPPFHYELFDLFQKHRMLALAAPRG